MYFECNFSVVCGRNLGRWKCGPTKRRHMDTVAYSLSDFAVQVFHGRIDSLHDYGLSRSLYVRFVRKTMETEKQTSDERMCEVS